MNFLLGKGETLTQDVFLTKGSGPKHHPYTLTESIDRLEPDLEQVVEHATMLPEEAKPGGYISAKVVLHPTYLAKSYFPAYLLRKMNLNVLGSKGGMCAPMSAANNNQASYTSQIIISGHESSFTKWLNELSNFEEGSGLAKDLIKIENISFFDSDEKIKAGQISGLYEVVLHNDIPSSQEIIFNGFKEYAKLLGAEVGFEQRVNVQGLTFIPVKISPDKVSDLAKYSFLRVIRPMPSLSPINPILRASENRFSVTFPQPNPLAARVKVAVFDGGLPKENALEPWAKEIGTKSIIDKPDAAESHGFSVSSALLFGPIEDNTPLEDPFLEIDHYRVIGRDDLSKEDPNQLLPILDKITNVLSTSNYEFVNLSLGPQLPIDDDDVHVWTAKLDELLASGNTLATVAVGNDGTLDPHLGLNRVQPPSDAVNALGVGATNSKCPNSWKKAAYSCVGPGRQPGIIKPDLVAFGGDISEPFHVPNAHDPSVSIGISGTSFASPLVLRTAAGIRSNIGPSISPLGIKALLVNRCPQHNFSLSDVGRGFVNHNLSSYLTSPDNEAVVLYQGELSPSKYMRVEIPIPDNIDAGMITINATICIASKVDPQDPVNYTRSGVEILFRPDYEPAKGVDKEHGDTRPFFRSAEHKVSEKDLRKDAHKWELVMSESKRFRASTLKSPVFDICYRAREKGQSDKKAEKIPYAMVITITASKDATLYQKIANKYKYQLEPLKPIENKIKI